MASDAPPFYRRKSDRVVGPPAEGPPETVSSRFDSDPDVEAYIRDALGLSHPAETDPHGFDPHAPGAKLDAGKVRVELVLAAFSRALWEVAKVGSYGAEKYSPNGWLSVPDAEARYLDAKGRHWLKNAMGERVDPDTGLDHLAHEAWNALAVLELRLRARKRVV